MGLFDDQLKTRLEQDRESFADALEALGESVTGKAAVTGKNGSLEDAVHEILTWFGAKAPEPPLFCVAAGVFPLQWLLCILCRCVRKFHKRNLDLKLDCIVAYVMRIKRGDQAARKKTGHPFSMDNIRE